MKTSFNTLSLMLALTFTTVFAGKSFAQETPLQRGVYAIAGSSDACFELYPLNSGEGYDFLLKGSGCAGITASHYCSYQFSDCLNEHERPSFSFNVVDPASVVINDVTFNRLSSINDKPRWRGQRAIQVRSGQPFSFDFEGAAYDPEGQPVTYAVRAGDWQLNGTVLTGTAPTIRVGSLVSVELHIAVSDGEKTSTHTFTVIVTNDR